MYDLYDRILGSLTAAGIGDGIGAPTEAMSYDEILKKYGRIERFVDGSDNLIAPGNEIAEITDDTSQMYEMVKAIIQTKGELTVEAAGQALINWSKNYPKYYPRNAGPTTRNMIEELKSGANPVEIGKRSGKYEYGTSNGAAMRIAGAGLCCCGDLQGAIGTAITMTSCSHGTHIAYSAACAVACAIAEALTESSSVHSIVKAFMYGAREGERIGYETARIAPGALVVPKALQAIKIAYTATDMQEAERLLCNEMGTDSAAIAQTVAIVLGLFIASDGDVKRAVLGGANIGGDTDTIACTVGMLAGAYSGYSNIDPTWIEQFEHANPNIDFKWAAKELVAINCKK